MPGALPTVSDFPPFLQMNISSPPPSSPRPTNIIIFLHGLGDTMAPFVQLGKQLNLPETACISLQGLTPLPFELGGFHWGNDITFGHASGQMDMDTGFSKISQILRQDMIEEVLVKKCGYTPRDIVLFGLGQGGMAALAAASSTTGEFGGVVSLGGPFPASTSAAKSSPTPVLLLGGSSKTMVTRPALEATRVVYKNSEYHKWNRSGDGMPTNREEMLPIMRFLARRLRSRQGVPEGSIEVT